MNERKATRVIVVASGKGGVGKSTCAVYLARALRRMEKSVLLIDADPALGCLDVMLGVERPSYSWIDAAEEVCAVKEATAVSADGVELLCSHSSAFEQEDADALKKVVETSRGNYDFIFIDAPAGIDDSFTAAAKCADSAIFVATADEISVKAAAVCADFAEKAGIARDETRLLINRFVKKQAVKSRLMNIDGVIDRSGVMLLGVLPEDKTIPTSSVTGRRPKEGGAFDLACGRVAKRVCGLREPLSFKKMK